MVKSFIGSRSVLPILGEFHLWGHSTFKDETCKLESSIPKDNEENFPIFDTKLCLMMPASIDPSVHCVDLIC